MIKTKCRPNAIPLKNKIPLKSIDVASVVSGFPAKRKESLTCLYLNSKNTILSKEVFLLPKHEKNFSNLKNIFGPAHRLKATRILFLRNSASFASGPTHADRVIFKKLIETAKLRTVNVADFIIIGKNNYYSFFNAYAKTSPSHSFVSDFTEDFLFDLVDKPLVVNVKVENQEIDSRLKNSCLEIQNRRFLGNKFRLLSFIEKIVNEKCENFKTFCDIFSGTGVVANRFNKKKVKIIANDILYSNYISLKAFLGTTKINLEKLEKKITYLSKINIFSDNYFSKNYGNTFFSVENARKIGAIREEIDKVADNMEERDVLLTSLIYAVDKVANTVGHYDAFRKKMDTFQPIKLLVPNINFTNNDNNEIYNEDSNSLIKRIESDVLYMDPPYNSRQYSDAYHLLENLATWKKPEVFGKAGKMDRASIKSGYCLKAAPVLFSDLIKNAQCKHILVSYNNTGDSRDGRSNARISDDEIIYALNQRGKVEIFTTDYKAFTTGKSDIRNNAERIFYCKVHR